MGEVIDRLGGGHRHGLMGVQAGWRANNKARPGPGLLCGPALRQRAVRVYCSSDMTMPDRLLLCLSIEFEACSSICLVVIVDDSVA